MESFRLCTSFLNLIGIKSLQATTPRLHISTLLDFGVRVSDPVIKGDQQEEDRIQIRHHRLIF